MQILALIINISLGLFGLTALWWSDKIKLKIRIILSIVLIILVMSSGVIGYIQSQYQAKLESQTQSQMIKQFHVLTSKVQENTNQTQIMSEIEGRPNVRLENELVKFNKENLNFIFPVKNYGKGIAEYVTLKFDSDQLENHSEISINDLSPNGGKYEFIIPAFYKLPRNFSIPKKHQELINDYFAGKKVLGSIVSGSYIWNGKKYMIPERYIMVDGNEIYIAFTKEPTISNSNESPKDINDINDKNKDN